MILGMRQLPTNPLSLPMPFSRTVLAVQGSLRRAKCSAPWTAPGRSENSPRRREKGGTAKANSLSASSRAPPPVGRPLPNICVPPLTM